MTTDKNQNNDAAPSAVTPDDVSPDQEEKFRYTWLRDGSHPQQLRN